MTKHIKLQKDYTASCLYYQIKLPLDIEKNIPSDDPVRLLSTFMEGMKLSDLYNTYEDQTRSGFAETVVENRYLCRNEPDLFQPRYREIV